ncbi:Azurin [Catalinimonas alkaloidigena]|uniref:Azurin n=1 Tax=Catalinimonas alkaloidigena TaxID=1075417 RepID=A0A1G8WSH6_9BACT|nr:plastocyanin/azurin family copper-binding protein [Catalinimonas alkaloidigena]SDJ80550.1 Azurin [Catalinimonas alkaloidigena]
MTSINHQLTLFGVLIAALLCVPQAIASPPVYPPPADTTVAIRAIEGLQYDVVRFVVAPGTRVTLTLENDDDMAHNMLITQPGERLAVVQRALTLAPATNYIPDTALVLFALPVVEPGETRTLTFTAPQQEGVYPYVCTLPGHGFIMYGAIYVQNLPMPPLANDPHIPPQRAKEGVIAQPESPHPYPMRLPMLYRTFMPECSPAAIAVGLPGDLSYCWDAGQCRLRYAWAGGFVDNTEHWKGNGNAFSKVIGTIYYRDCTPYPWDMGQTDSVPQTQFKGYRLVERYPEFNYTVEGVEVHERIYPLTDSVGLRREFRFGPTSAPFYLATTPNDGVVYRASTGTWEGARLKLPAGTRTLTLEMVKSAPEHVHP